MTDERTVKRLRPDVEEFLFHEEQKRARWAHRLLRDHAVIVGDHAPELRRPYMTFGREFVFPEQAPNG